MAAPTITVPTTGTDPKVATKTGLEGQINAGFSALHDDTQTRLEKSENLADLPAKATARNNLGLGAVNNTSDDDKPVSTAQQTALDGKADKNNPTFTGNVQGVTKGHVGLGNADNTSDADKPVSTAQQAALNGKADTDHGHAIGDVSGLQAALNGKATAAQGGKADTALQSADMTSHKDGADQHPISGVTGLQAALNARADAAATTAALNAKSDAAATTAALADKASGAELDSVIVGDTARPEFNQRFSSVLTGAARAKIANGAAAVSDDLGAVWRLTGTDQVGGFQDIAPRIDQAIEPGRVYRARFRFMRVTDPVDPSGHAIEVRIQNLNKNRAAVSNVVISDVTATVADGVQSYVFTFSAGAGHDYQCPSSARYAVPFLRLYGADHETDIAVISVEDVTDVQGKADAAETSTSLLSKAAVSRQITGGGLVSGGGDLSADRTLTVEAASEAEALAGTVSDKVMTPERDAQALAVETAARQAQAKIDRDTQAAQAETDRRAPLSMRPPYIADGRIVLEEDPAGATHHIDLETGRRVIHNLKMEGGDGHAQDGMVPLMRDAAGNPVISYDGFDDVLVAEKPLLGRSSTPPMDGIQPSELDAGGAVLSGYEPGQHIRVHPEQLDGLTIQGDANKIPQLFHVVEGVGGSTDAIRQLTYSQHGVTGWQVVRRPTAAAPGLIRVFSNDQDVISARHKARYVEWHLPSVEATPTKMVAILMCGQSNSVGAGFGNFNPSGISGPQTIRTTSPIRNAPWPSRNLTFVGGTIPHQGDLDGDNDIGDGTLARDVAITADRIASLVPMAEGLGGASGAQRESLCAALATQLNGPNGYDGSVYLVSASFGFGSSAWETLMYDGSNVRQTAWQNLLNAATQLKTMANAQNLDLEVHILIDQGEANASDTTYKARVETSWALMKADVTAITGQSAAPQLFLAQTLKRRTGSEPAYSSLAQVAAARDNADIHVLPPFYIADFESDETHYKPTETQWRGALYGEVLADWLIRGEDAALLVTAATYSGDQMRVDFNHPLSRDERNIVLSDIDAGVSHKNNAGATRSIEDARPDPANPNRFNLTFVSDVPSGAAEVARVAYGNNDSGAMGWGGGPDGGGMRSTLRRGDWLRYSMIDGRPLFIFANIQEISATEG